MQNNCLLNEAAEGKVISRAGELFSAPAVVRNSGYVRRYEELIRENKLFFTPDIIKDKLAGDCKQTDEALMAADISDIMNLCAVTQNKRLLWFRRLLDKHFEGIIAHAAFNITSGRIEGINNKIKTLRRKGFGYPDDDYFFLKLFNTHKSTDIGRSAGLTCPLTSESCPALSLCGHLSAMTHRNAKLKAPHPGSGSAPAQV